MRNVSTFSYHNTSTFHKNISCEIANKSNIIQNSLSKKYSLQCIVMWGLSAGQKDVCGVLLVSYIQLSQLYL